MEYLLKQFAAVLVVLLAAGVAVRAQNCGSNLANVQVCAPLVLPGAANPSPTSECCAALQSTQKDCLCSALRAAIALPSLCNLPPISCDVSA